MLVASSSLGLISSTEPLLSFFTRLLPFASSLCPLLLACAKIRAPYTTSLLLDVPAVDRLHTNADLRCTFTAPSVLRWRLDWATRDKAAENERHGRTKRGSIRFTDCRPFSTDHDRKNHSHANHQKSVKEASNVSVTARVAGRVVRHRLACYGRRQVCSSKGGGILQPRTTFVSRKYWWSRCRAHLCIFLLRFSPWSLVHLRLQPRCTKS